MAIRLEDLPLQVQERIARQQLWNQKKKPKQKYRNHEIQSGNLKFKSRAEERRFYELLPLWKMGVIQELKLQPQFTLIESYIRPTGEKVGRMRYTADFSYKREGALVVEDVKSKATKTTDYQMRKKMMLDIYGIEIQEIEY